MKNVVTDFGAVGDGVTDDSAAFQNGLNNTRGTLYCPSLNYAIASPLTMNNSYTKLACDSKGSATLLSSATAPTLSVVGTAHYCEIENICFDRTTIPTAGCDGIVFQHGANLASISGVEVKNHWVGLNLGYTGYSAVKNFCYIHDNYSHGILMQATNLAGGFQWTLDNVLIQTNNGWGMAILGATAGTNTLSLGEFNNVSTYANGAGGICIFGNVHTRFEGIRFLGGFIGQDGGHLLSIDSYSNLPNKIIGTFFELAGRAPCGRGTAMPAPNTGYGIYISPNVAQISLSGITCTGNSLSGIYTTGGKVNIGGSSIFSYNGAAGVVGNQSGIFIGGGRTIAEGNTSTLNTVGITSATDNHIICDNSLSGNTVAAYSGVPLVTSKYANNLIV